MTNINLYQCINDSSFYIHSDTVGVAYIQNINNQCDMLFWHTYYEHDSYMLNPMVEIKALSKILFIYNSRIMKLRSGLNSTLETSLCEKYEILNRTGMDKIYLMKPNGKRLHMNVVFDPVMRTAEKIVESLALILEND